MNQNSAEPDLKWSEWKWVNPVRRKDTNSTIRIKGKSDDEEGDDLTEVLKKFFERQKNSVIPKIGAGREEWWDEERWDTELTEDLLPLIMDVADAHGKSTADILGTEYIKELTAAYLRKLTEGRAHAINSSTLEKLLDAIEGELEPAEVLEKRESHDAETFGQALATQVAGWAMLEAVHQAQDHGYSKTVEKEWVTGPNSRPSHAAMNGQRVGIDDTFSNGAKWPGDDNLSPDESCGCNCSTDVIITEG